MLLLDMTVQGVPASENGLAYSASEFELEMCLDNMPDDAFLVHHHATFGPIAPEFRLVASYDPVAIAQVRRE